MDYTNSDHRDNVLRSQRAITLIRTVRIKATKAPLRVSASQGAHTNTAPAGDDTNFQTALSVSLTSTRNPRACASAPNHAHVTAPVLQSTRMLQRQWCKPRACYSTSAPIHSHATAPVLQATAQSVESRALTRPRQDLVHCRLYYTQGIIHNPRKYPVNLGLGSRAVPLDTRVLKLKPPRTRI